MRPPFRRWLRFRLPGLLLLLLLLGLSMPVAAQQGSPQGWPANMVPLTVEGPPPDVFNRLSTSVTVCVPGTNRCATIDHVLVDTGSVGLRLQAKAMPDFLRLPVLADGQGRPMGECLRFIGNAAWGLLHRGDVRLGGMTARDIPLQIIGEERPRPASCPGGPAAHTANGTLGLGWSPTDCSGNCIQNPEHPGYLVCGSDGCVAAPGGVPIGNQLPNPVSRFPAHNNGEVFDLPMPVRRGIEAVQGTLTFGIGTAADNGLGQARLLKLGPRGRFTTRYGTGEASSYIDSGTKSYIVPDPDLQRCPGRDSLCVAPTRHLHAQLVGTDGQAIPVSFLVGRSPGRGENGVFASAAWGARPEQQLFVWGLPFFLGKRLSLMFKDKSLPADPAQVGPFYAIAPTTLANR